MFTPVIFIASNLVNYNLARLIRKLVNQIIILASFFPQCCLHSVDFRKLALPLSHTIGLTDNGLEHIFVFTCQSLICQDW
jgi:hypothetical protein